MQKNKKIFLISIFSLILCLTLLTGTVFAWFTFSNRNSGNQVRTGGLGVRLLQYKNGSYVDISDGTGDIFDSEMLWEPGKTEIAFLQVENYKSLPASYHVLVEMSDKIVQTVAKEVKESAIGLEDALEYAIIPSVTAEGFQEQKPGSWEEIVEIYGLEYDVADIGEKVYTGSGTLESGDQAYFAVVVHMKSDVGNEFNEGQKILLDVKVEAGQLVEKESESYYFDVLCGLGSFESHTAADRYLTHFQKSGDEAYVPEEAFVKEGDNTVLRIMNSYWTHFQKCTGTTYTKYLETGSQYFLSLKVRCEDPDRTVPRILFVSKMKDDTQQWLYYDAADYVDELKTQEWQEIWIPVPEEYSDMKSFRYGLGTRMADKNAERAAVDYDDVQLLKVVTPDSTQAMLEEWNEKLAAEKANSQMVEEVIDLNTWKPALDGAENLIVNGSFAENLDNWRPFNANHTQNAHYIEDGYEGGTGGAIRMQRQDEALDPMWSQSILVEAGCEYQVSFYYRVPAEFEPLTARIGVHVEFYSDPTVAGGDTWLGSNRVGPIKGEIIADGEWHFYHERILLQDNVGRLLVSPRMRDANDFYMDIDEVVVYKTSAGTDFTLDTNGIFFYTDEESTTLSMEVNSREYPEYTKGFVVYQLYDGDRMLWESDRIPYAESSASTEMDLDLLYKTDHPFCVKATAYAQNGVVVRTITKELFKYERPEYLSKDGKYTKFGEDFDPIVGYHAYGDEDRIKARDEGAVNVIQCASKSNAEEVLEQLDKCAELGLKGLVCLYANMKPSGHSDNLLKTIDIVSDPRIQNHEALYAYNIMDEPGIYADATHQALQDSYRLIRQYDQKNVIILVENMRRRYEKSAEYVDILYLDRYTLAKEALVYSAIVKAIEDSGGDRCVFYLGEAFVGSAYSRYATADDVRNNNWQAMIAGSGNLGYYSISDSGNNPMSKEEESAPEFLEKYPDGYMAIWETPFKDDPDHGAKLWAGIVEFAEKEKDLAFDHFVHGKGTRLATDANLDANYIYSSWVTENNEVYAVVLNVKGDDNTVTVPLKKADGSDMGAFTANVVAGRDAASEQTIYTGNGSLTVDMTGVEAILFKIQE